MACVRAQGERGRIQWSTNHALGEEWVGSEEAVGAVGLPLGFGSEYRRRAVLCSKRKTGAQHAGAGWGGGRDHCGGGETTEDRPWSVATTRVPHHQPQRTPGPSEPPSCGWGWSQTSGVGGDWAASSPALSKPQFPARPGQGLQKALRSWEPQGPEQAPSD